MKTFGKILGLMMYVLIAAAIAWIVYVLFFVNEQEVEITEEKRLEEFTIIYPEFPVSLEPTSTVPSTRQLLINVFEPLVRFDADLNAEPALALYWGLIDELTWEFRLREDVLFHDGTALDSADVVYTLDRARGGEFPQIADLLSSIDSVEVIDDLTLRITTLEPDPLLLQRLSTVLILPEGAVAGNPIGTGPYMFAEGGGVVAYENYWAGLPQFDRVNLVYEADKSRRTALFLNGEADFLSFVPFDGVPYVEDAGFEIVFVPTLEVQFLIFNQESSTFSDPIAKEAVALALNRQELVDEIGTQARVVNQFVSSGVFGSNSKIDGVDPNLQEAQALIEEAEIKGHTVQIHLLQGLEVLGEYLRVNLTEAGLSPVVSYLDFDGLIASMSASKADLYFLAFKSDLGDSMDFFDQVVVSGAEFNYFSYDNDLVNELIDSASTEMNVVRRRDFLQSAMEVIVDDEVFGIPLFEYEVGYSFNDKIQYEPRIDGLIYYNDLIIK